MGPASDNILDVQGLEVGYRTGSGMVMAVRELDIGVRPGEVVGLLGESGSGKSSAAAAIMGLVPDPPGRVTARRMVFEGVDLLNGSESDIHALRGQRLSMIFQNPVASLNPVLSVGYQLRELYQLHTDLSGPEIRERSESVLAQVGIPDPKRRLDAYPHELSGGMSQRVMIALAVALEPSLLIADEPTTALDVTVQAQIIELLDKLRRDTGMAVVLITHNLALLANVAQRVLVMYAGRIVEEGPTAQVLRRPSHPYTSGLIASIPVFHDPKPLRPIGGAPPNPRRTIKGCSFQPRCPLRQPICLDERPALEDAEPGHSAACHFRDAPIIDSRSERGPADG